MKEKEIKTVVIINMMNDEVPSHYFNILKHRLIDVLDGNVNYKRRRRKKPSPKEMKY